MVDRNRAVEEQQPSSPKEPRISSAFSEAQAKQHTTFRRNALAEVRLGSPTTAPITNKEQRHEQLQHQGPPHTTALLEQREIADTRRNIAVQVDPLSPTLQKMGAHAGDLRPAAAPAQGVAISPPVAAAADAGGGGEDKIPSLQLLTGGIRVLGGHAEDGTDNIDSAVACVLIYMLVVVVAIAGVLVYFFRSLYAGPPEMTPIEYDETEEKLTRTHRTLEPPTTTVGHEQERAVPVPLHFARRGKRTSAMPHGPDVRGVDGGGNGLVTSGTADVKEVNGEEVGDMVSLPVVTLPDEEQRFVQYLAFPPASSEGYSSRTHSDNWNWTRSVKSLDRKNRFK